MLLPAPAHAPRRPGRCRRRLAQAHIPNEDADAIKQLEKPFKTAGITLNLGAKATRVEETAAHQKLAEGLKEAGLGSLGRPIPPAANEAAIGRISQAGAYPVQAGQRMCRG